MFFALVHEYGLRCSAPSLANFELDPAYTSSERCSWQKVTTSFVPRMLNSHTSSKSANDCTIREYSPRWKVTSGTGAAGDPRCG